MKSHKIYSLKQRLKIVIHGYALPERAGRSRTWKPAQFRCRRPGVVIDDPIRSCFYCHRLLGVLIFIITSMLGMGFSLTIPQIIAPLKNRRLVVMSLLANFVLVPILALVIVRVIPLSEGLQVGLILVGFAAGAPFLPKLVQVARGGMAFTAGLMVLLMVVTIAYLPIVLPFVLTGVQLNPWEIAGASFC